MSQNSPEFHRPVKKSQLCCAVFFFLCTAACTPPRVSCLTSAAPTTRPAARAARVATSEFVTSPAIIWSIDIMSVQVKNKFVELGKIRKFYLSIGGMPGGGIMELARGRDVVRAVPVR